MDIEAGVIDYGNAPDIYVHGVQRVVLLSPGLVRVSLFAPYPSGSALEMRTTLHLLWDRERFLKMGPVYDQARSAVAFAGAFQLAGVGRA
jgi:hypothetical protein